MREMIKMIVVLTVLSSFSGGLLAVLKNGTQERIENQQLQFVKGPAINSILKGASNDPIKDRLKIGETSFFVGIFDSKPKVVAFENYGKGFGGDIGVMVGVDLNTDEIIGIGVTTHNETPGVGSKTKSDPSFGNQFKGLKLGKTFKVKTDGGHVDALSGATVSSKGVCAAVTASSLLYKEKKPEIIKMIKEKF